MKTPLSRQTQPTDVFKEEEKKKRLKLQQNSDKTNSSGFLTQIRRKSLIEPELTGVAVEGVAERVEKTKSQVERQCWPEVARRRTKLPGDTQPFKMRSL